MIRCLRNCYIVILGTFSEIVDSAISLIMTDVKNVNIDELALAIDKVVCSLNEYDLQQLTKKLSLYNNNLASKGKRYLKKTIEKYCEGILDYDGLSENVNKQQLRGIIADVTPTEGKSTTATRDQQQGHVVSRTPSVIAAVDVSWAEGSNQSNFLRELGILNRLRKDLL